MSDNNPIDFKPWDNGGANLDKVTEPPCRTCINFRPEVSYFTRSDGRQIFDGVRICHGDDMWPDFSCYKPRKDETAEETILGVDLAKAREDKSVMSEMNIPDHLLKEEKETVVITDREQELMNENNQLIKTIEAVTSEKVRQELINQSSLAELKASQEGVETLQLAVFSLEKELTAVKLARKDLRQALRNLINSFDSFDVNRGSDLSMNVFYQELENQIADCRDVMKATKKRKK